MLDWSVVIIPLAVLAIILLLPFAGCDLDDHGGKSGEPATVETAVIPIKLFWQVSATDIQTISLTATVQPLNAAEEAVDALVKPPGNSTSGWKPDKYLDSSGDVTVSATIEKPFVAKYRVKATATVIQGAWDSDVFPFTRIKEKTFDDTLNWNFVLANAGGAWTFD